MKVFSIPSLLLAIACLATFTTCVSGKAEAPGVTNDYYDDHGQKSIRSGRKELRLRASLSSSSSSHEKETSTGTNAAAAATLHDGDNSTTVSPTLSPAPTLTNHTQGNVTMAPSITPNNDNNSTNTTAVPSMAPSMVANHTHAPSAAAVPTVVPAPTPDNNATTAAPHKAYTSSPTTASNNDNPKKKKSFFRKFLSFIGWLLLITAIFLAFGACMSHRTQIYFFLLELWHAVMEKLSGLGEVCEGFTYKVGLVCAGMGRTVRNMRIGDRLVGLWGRIRGLGGGNNGVGTMPNDEDGSMMQGLLLRENM